MLTAREMLEFRCYAERYPIDDESNYHVPLAQLCAMFYSANRGEGAPPRELLDFVVFRDHEADAVQAVESGFDRVLMGPLPEAED